MHPRARSWEGMAQEEGMQEGAGNRGQHYYFRQSEQGRPGWPTSQGHSLLCVPW